MKQRKATSGDSPESRGGLGPSVWRDERGVVAVVAALMLAVFIGMAGLVVDLGYLFVVRSMLQNAADAGSLAAAASLSYGPEEARNQAQLLAGYHTVHGSPVALTPADIELGTWDMQTKVFSVLPASQEDQANSVRVTAHRSAGSNNPIPLFFMPVFGKNTSDVRARSVAYFQPPLCGAIIGESGVELESSTRTDSYNSTSGPYSPTMANQNGDTCSCGDISLTSSATVNGDATPGPGGTVHLSSSAVVTGSTAPGFCPTLPPVALGDVATNNDNGSIPHELTLENDDQVTLTGGRYYFTSLILEGNSQLRVTGPSVVYVTEVFNMQSGSIVNQSNDPKDLSILISSSDDVDLESSTAFHGVIYAPNARVELQSSTEFFGAILADWVNMQSSAQVHYDEALADLSVLSDMELPLIATGSSLMTGSILVQ